MYAPNVSDDFAVGERCGGGGRADEGLLVDFDEFCWCRNQSADEFG